MTPWRDPEVMPPPTDVVVMIRMTGPDGVPRAEWAVRRNLKKTPKYVDYTHPVPWQWRPPHCARRIPRDQVTGWCWEREL